MKTILAIIVPACVVFGLAIANIAYSAKTVNIGEYVHNLEQKNIVLRLEQKDLDEELATSLSLRTLREEAVAQGFIPISSVSFLTAARPVAMR
ncbi:MAG: hypothetical protein HZA34_01100 [Candidatus Pacebacteria bacterium]|nr:hypothetical protein [Candidatus Paceibacterota bacterium]